MSKIALSGNASGTGTLTIASQNTNSNYTLTIPNETGTLTTTASTPTFTGAVTAPGFIPNSSTVPSNGLYLPAANAVGIATNTTNAVYINSSQQVGIGTTSPGCALDIASSGDTKLKISKSGGSTFSVYTGGSYPVMGSESNSDFVFITNNTERARITSGGNFQTSGTSTKTGYGIYNASGQVTTFANGATFTITLPTTFTSGIFCLLLEDETNGNRNTRQMWFASNRYGSAPQITSLGSHNGSTAGVSYSVSTSSSSNAQTITITNSQGQNMSGFWAYTGLAI